jgi:hypothetical protein
MEEGRKVARFQSGKEDQGGKQRSSVDWKWKGEKVKKWKGDKVTRWKRGKVETLQGED